MNAADLPLHEIPALSGNNAPIHQEDVFDNLPVLGTVPADFSGLYVRNGPNAYYPPDWRYHAYDGDGMLHAVRFDKGRVSYRNRWIQTAGLQEELAAGHTLWKGLKEPPRADRPDQPLKNNSNTDVKYHAGRLLTMWYRSGVPYAVDPFTLETLGPVDIDGPATRISAHSRPDEHTGELMWFDYDTKPPYMRYGVVGPDRQLRHAIDVDLPGPSLPHDMALTEHYTILHDFPLHPDPDALAAGRYKVRFYPELPSRFGIVPRYGKAEDVRWFEAKPAYMLHVVNAWEEGDEVVMVGTPYRMHPGEDGQIDSRRLERTINQRQRDFLLYEWRFDLKTGLTKERVIDDVLNTEFPVINSAYQGRKNRWSYNVVFPPGGREEPRFPGLVKYDLETGGYIAYSAGPQFFYNEPGFAPRDNPRSEDDGYLVTLAWNPNEQRSEIQLFDCFGAAFAQGPVARVVLPRRVPNGFHATFVSQATLNRWK
ncbi:carotenoid oxygenase family protein [Hydrogenophaga sp. BPS33]|uniref:carotenoid oxygenase family protein n=1 Tax=Hydrogenophaga sp. BPS33 TaxID=2651974 RepID=UPI00131FDA57|nr:carotenoid oxygenase family protein [Hydrogenophaga sp. BPS33]QHE87396.1 apocarotenoid-15,15'-oxygenase [Hydrogenophaga sp. BPS33]